MSLFCARNLAYLKDITSETQGRHLSPFHHRWCNVPQVMFYQNNCRRVSNCVSLFGHLEPVWIEHYGWKAAKFYESVQIEKWSCRSSKLVVFSIPLDLNICGVLYRGSIGTFYYVTLAEENYSDLRSYLVTDGPLCSLCNRDCFTAVIDGCVGTRSCSCRVVN